MADTAAEKQIVLEAQALIDGDRDNPGFDSPLGRRALAALDREIAAAPAFKQKLADTRWIMREELKARCRPAPPFWGDAA